MGCSCNKTVKTVSKNTTRNQNSTITTTRIRTINKGNNNSGQKTKVIRRVLDRY